MTLSTWQLIVVAGLAMVWAVVLGVPLLADLLRWLRSRPPTPRIDRRPARHNLVESIERAWWNRPRPIRSWRSQDVARKRLQWLLACGGATTTAMFLAIAFRGIFVPLFLMMAAFSLLTLAVGAFVGAAENENLVSQRSARRQVEDQASKSGDVEAVGDMVLPGLLGATPLTGPDDVPTANPFAVPDGEVSIPTLADITEAFRSPDRSGFMFEPLNLDEIGSESSPREQVAETVAEELSAGETIEVPVDPELAAELGLDMTDRAEPRFSAAPEAGSRQASARARRKKRSTARPIFIESMLDDDNPTKAIND